MGVGTQLKPFWIAGYHALMAVERIDGFA